MHSKKMHFYELVHYMNECGEIRANSAKFISNIARKYCANKISNENVWKNMFAIKNQQLGIIWFLKDGAKISHNTA